MTQQIIGIGVTADDGKGDKIRVAFDKCNSNFTELYTGSGAIASALNLRSSPFNAIGDGNVDDTDAIARWLAALQAAPSPVIGYAPVGNYVFKSPLSIGIGGKQGVTICGDGPYQTIFTYAGASTTPDLFSVGDGINFCINWSLRDFKITSRTVMTAGTGLRMKRLVRSFATRVVLDGQDGAGNLWNGFWFDSIDEVFLNEFEARGRNDGVRVCGTPGGGQAGLFLHNGKIASCGVGLRIGGGFGGFECSATDIIANNVNVIIDKTLTGTPNFQIYFMDAFLDTPVVGPNMQIFDTGTFAESVLFFIGTWIASSPNVGLNIKPGCTFRMAYTGGFIGNNQHDGVYDESAGAAHLVFTGVFISENGSSGAGWGINASSPTNMQISDCHFENNHDGNISSTVNGVVAGGSTGSYFYPFGNGLSLTCGSGLPTIPAAHGSIYVRTDGSSTTTRLYINTDGGTGWTNVVTSA